MPSAPEEYSRLPAATEFSSSKDPRDWGRALSRALEALAELLSGETGAAAAVGLLGQDLIIRLTTCESGVEVMARLPAADDDSAIKPTDREDFPGIR